MNGLGRIAPLDYSHVARFPLSAVFPQTVVLAERILRLPWWHKSHDQSSEGSCVGHAVAMERSITNIAQAKLAALLKPGRRYDPIDVWNEAKIIDEFPFTNPGDSEGTSLRAGYEIARSIGLVRVRRMDVVGGRPTPVDPLPRSIEDGVATYRWAASVDEIRTAVQGGLPVAIGIDWYNDFDQPIKKEDGSWWIGTQTPSAIRGGHAVTIFGVSDKRQAFKLKNSWGTSYPQVWLPYTTMAKLMENGGEAAIVTDR